MKNMKKLLIALVFIVTLLLTFTACESVAFLSPDNINLDKAYSFSANMQFNSLGNEFSAAANFERQSSGVWNVTFTEPYALAGVTMAYNSGTVVSAFENAEFTTTANNDGVVIQVIEAFENAVNGEGREIVVGGRGVEEIRITSKAGVRARSFELILCKKSYQPLTLTIAESALSVSFSEVQVSQITQVILPKEGTESQTATTATRSQWEEDLRMD